MKTTFQKNDHNASAAHLESRAETRASGEGDTSLATQVLRMLDHLVGVRPVQLMGPPVANDLC